VGRAWLSVQQLDALIETDGPLEAPTTRLNSSASSTAKVWGQGFAPPVFCDEFRVVKPAHPKSAPEAATGAQTAALRRIWFGQHGLAGRACAPWPLPVDANE